MFVVIIIIAVIAAIAISNITVEINNKEITMSNVNVFPQGPSIASVVKAYTDWSNVDTSVEECSAEAINIVFTTNGTWKMVRVVNKSVKFSGRSFYNSNNVSGILLSVNP